eukprot:gnl/TRDRNA2_/TRDRNA2_179657_c0_seq1.p1 gnl/TRDRNA2_/TRDRNA2_179657_c0~~gnl/TRDRNA2_/TRDRNA2_179657_c0_seq1.p1  ORF type:complete len:204 (+),score=10.67 gnl/TRDRNA2_/TRDRNA2_179657_c0_seq1:84-695(+)
MRTRSRMRMADLAQRWETLQKLAELVRCGTEFCWAKFSLPAAISTLIASTIFFAVGYFRWLLYWVPLHENQPSWVILLACTGLPFGVALHACAVIGLVMVGWDSDFWARDRRSAPVERERLKVERVRLISDTVKDECVVDVHPSNACSICYAPFAGHEGEVPLLRTGCGHVFHEECLDSWLQRHKSCPLCRHDLLKPQRLASA